MPRSAWILCLAAMTASASAQSAREQAKTLFRQGKDLLGQQKFAEACTAFESSYQLHPNIATLLNHADCREKNAQIATAWRLFIDAKRQTDAHPDETSKQLNAVATTRAGELLLRLSNLSIDVAPDFRLDGLEILRDAVKVDPGEWNQLLPIDGGTYKITARAPGRTAWSTTVVVNPESDIQRVAIPKLAPEAAAELKPDERPPPPPPGVSNPEPVPDRRREIGNSQRPEGPGNLATKAKDGLFIAPGLRTAPPSPPTDPTSPSALPPGATPPSAPPASATPEPARLRAKVPVGEPSSASLALALSLGGTIASYGLAIGANFLPKDSDIETSPTATLFGAVGSLGILLAPSFGHWYGGKIFPRGMKMRLMAPLVLIIAIGVGGDSFDRETVGGIIGSACLGMFVYGTIHDIVTAPRRVRQRNRERGFVIAPIVSPRSAGLALGGQF